MVVNPADGSRHCHAHLSHVGLPSAFHQSVKLFVMFPDDRALDRESGRLRKSRRLQRR